ncbi:MAG: hypothetical protein LAO03_07990 [Acidobacteriia bacterium]|nr:hypothetical protein [Terriglobia bacterium]
MGRKARLGSAGLKTIDGRKLIALRYKPKKGADLSIVLYFDPQTFHHVMTVYSVIMASGLAVGENSEVRSARMDPSRYRIEERFSNFKAIGGLSLPSHYDLRFTRELSGYSSSEEWEVTVTRVMNNPDLDPKNFEMP